MKQTPQKKYLPGPEDCYLPFQTSLAVHSALVPGPARTLAPVGVYSFTDMRHSCVLMNTRVCPSARQRVTVILACEHVISDQ